MFEHDVRWYALIPTAMLMALAHLTAEMGGLWFSFPARPEWLWALAFYATLRTPPVQALAAFFLCGLLRDCILGPRLGAGAMAYLVVGWVTLNWRFLATSRGWPMQALVAAWSAFFVAMLKHALDYGPLAYKLLYRVFFVSFGDGVLTGFAYLPLLLVLSLDSFRPWRQRGGYGGFNSY